MGLDSVIRNRFVNDVHDIAQRTRSIFRDAFGIAAAFYGTHLLWVLVYILYALIRNAERYFGNDIPMRNFALLYRTLLPVIVAPLFVSFVIGVLGTFLIRFPSRPSLRNYTAIGFGSYVCLMAWLLLLAPGALVKFPILRSIPFFLGIICLLILITASCWLVFSFVQRATPVAVWGFCHLLLVLIPHDAFRALRRIGEPELPRETRRMLVFVVDAARLDSVRDVFNGTEHKVYRGISHFGSTRKQWRLLLTGNTESVEKSFFLPSKRELADTRADELLTEYAHREGLRTCFIIDDPLTVSQSSLGVVFDDYRSPSSNAISVWMAESPLFPVYGWLWNILGSGEGVNYWSDFHAFQRDVFHALRTNHVVFAHTVLLQKPISSYGEFNSLFGLSWLAQRPSEYQSIGEKADQALGVDARIVYLLKLRRVLDLLSKSLLGDYQSMPISGVLTSDHGQEFIATMNGNKHFAGLHGWDISPDVIWIPMLFFGNARWKGPADGNVDWLSLRHGIIEWMAGRRSLEVAGTTGPISFKTQFIPKTHITGGDGKSLPDNVASMKQIIDNSYVDWENGVLLHDSFVSRDFCYAKGLARGQELTLVNPDISGGAVVTKWNLYTLESSTHEKSPAASVPAR